MTAQPSAETTATPAQRIGWAVLIFITLYICYFSHLGVIGFVGPDEPRYAWIARDMAETGDWVTPRLYGKPWFEKPPLLYWGGAVFFKLLGEDHPEVAARLPSAISALLATLALAWLAWRTYGEECARWLLLLLPTSVGMIGFSHAAATDMPFAGMLTITMVCAAVALGLVESEDTPILPRIPWLALLLFGFFLGLAVLAKGPAGVILVGGAIFLWAISTKRWRDAFRLLHPAAIAAFCATALPWYIFCARRNPDFFRVFIIEHNFKRYLTPEFQHIQPFWYYLPIFCIALLPWITGVISLGKIPQAGRNRDSAERAFRLYGVCWSLWPLVFFSASKSKLPGYILPAVLPSILIVVGEIFSVRSRAQTTARTVSLLVGATLLASAITFAVMGGKIPSGQDIIPAPWHGPIFLSLLIGGIISSVLAWSNRAMASFLCSTASLLFALLGAYNGLYWMDPVYSARRSASEARKIYREFDPTEAAVYRVPRGIEFGLNYYLRQELPSWKPGDRSTRWVFTPYSGTAELEKEGFRCPHYIVFPSAFPCEAKDLLDRPGGGRQPEQKE